MKEQTMGFRPERFGDTNSWCRNQQRPADGEQARRRQMEEAWAARDAELAAAQTTRRLLGADASARWRGRPDGTAIGWVHGLVMSWAPPELDGPEFLVLHRDCPACGACWSTPVLSRAQLLASLMTDRCACQLDELPIAGSAS